MQNLTLRQWALLFSSIIFILSGCVTTDPTGNIEVFGTVASGVTEKVDNVIKEYNQALVLNELTKIAQRTSPLSMAKLDPVKKVIIKDADKKNYALYKANKSLGSYAGALTALSRAGSREEIDLAATQLYGSLHNMNEQYKTLKETDDDLITDKMSSLLGRITGEIAGFYIEQKRNKKIKEIVIAADPPIQKICEVVETELLKGVMEGRLYTMKYTELSGYIKDFNKTVKTATFAKKKTALDEIYKKYIEMQSSSASIQTSVKAIKAIKKAHGLIKKGLEDNKFSSKKIIDAIGKLKDIHDHYDDLEVLMFTCKGEIIADPDKGIICKDKNPNQ